MCCTAAGRSTTWSKSSQGRLLSADVCAMPATVHVMDIQDWKGHVMSRQKHGCPVTCGNPLDLLSPAGYAPFACIMNWRPILEHPANQSTQPPAKVAPLDNIEVPAWICRDVRLGLLVLRQCQQRLNQTALLFAVRGRDSPVCAARQSTCQ